MMCSQAESKLSETESVCPECLAKIPASKVAVGRDVYMTKSCPEHGPFSAILWRGDPSYISWTRPKIPCSPSNPNTQKNIGCPFDCGLCPEHRQQTCVALLEVTQRCNLSCSYCFADSHCQNKPDPELGVVRSWYETLLATGHPCNVQLSGGEPTLRDDLPAIIALGRELGVEFIQLNTNGLRLAQDPSFARCLKEAGLSSVFLQFDGISDDVHRNMRGKSLLQTKLEAIRICDVLELGVILVPTLVPGVNVGQIGSIILFAIENVRVIRGVHFQPVSHFGRYPNIPTDKDRLTLPEVIKNIEIQTDGLIKSESFRPPGCENALCSFHGNFVVLPEGRVKALTRYKVTNSCCEFERAEEGATKARDFVAGRWRYPIQDNFSEQQNSFSFGEWDILLERTRTHSLCISGMAFQDAWNLDLQRLKDCCVHVVTTDGKLVPFCAYNLTGSRGHSIYR
jgi:7,8-dihydro-6-hydroxymethylpterin dimethyltransferase